MTDSTTVPPGLVTREIAPEEWGAFLAVFTRENRGAHARLEVLGEDAGSLVETEGRPFDGVSADYKDGERSVWISFASTPGDHFTHGVHRVKRIYVRPPLGRLGSVLEIEGHDRTKTLLQLSWPEEYALPPGEHK